MAVGFHPLSFSLYPFKYAESMFEQPALDYREFPHFEVRNSLEAQTEQCAARLQRHNIDLDGWTFNL
jgi:hypothetical protein